MSEHCTMNSTGEDDTPLMLAYQEGRAEQLDVDRKRIEELEVKVARLTALDERDEIRIDLEAYESLQQCIYGAFGDKGDLHIEEQIQSVAIELGTLRGKVKGLELNLGDAESEEARWKAERDYYAKTLVAPGETRFWQVDCDHSTEVIDVERVADVLRERDELKANLKKYGMHTLACWEEVDTLSGECVCGLNECKEEK